MQAATGSSPGADNTTTIRAGCKSPQARGPLSTSVLEQVLVLVGCLCWFRLLGRCRHQVALAVFGDGLGHRQFPASPALVGHLALCHQLVDERDRALQFGGGFTDSHGTFLWLLVMGLDPSARRT